jgi:hypothetical protein
MHSLSYSTTGHCITPPSSALPMVALLASGRSGPSWISRMQVSTPSVLRMTLACATANAFLVILDYGSLYYSTQFCSILGGRDKSDPATSKCTHSSRARPAPPSKLSRGRGASRLPSRGRQAASAFLVILDYGSLYYSTQFCSILGGRDKSDPATARTEVVSQNPQG